MNRLARKAILAASAAALAAPALAFDMPSDFASLDANADARVEFKEFADYAKTQGVTSTLAAQHFTKMSAGDAYLTEDEFFLASAVGATALEPAPAYAEPAVTVETPSLITAEPVQPEAVMSSVEMTPPVDGDVETDVDVEVDTSTEATTDLPEGALIVTEPTEDVAGEVETIPADVDTTATMESETEIELSDEDDDGVDVESEADIDMESEEDPLLP